MYALIIMEGLRLGDDRNEDEPVAACPQIALLLLASCESFVQHAT